MFKIQNCFVPLRNTPEETPGGAQQVCTSGGSGWGRMSACLFALKNIE